jgi:hypothetical protein
MPAVMVELNHVKSRGELQRLAELHQAKEFLFYSEHSDAKRIEMRSLLSYIGLTHMTGMRCLDIGPGYGDSLDVWHDLGASECAFVEKEPWLYAHNRLKPFAHGWQANHLWSLDKLPRQHFDFIWSRGAISHTGNYLRFSGRFGLARWLRSVERLAAPNAQLIICPCRGKPWMDRVFLAMGYESLPFIEGHNIAHLYPVTWRKLIS